MSVSTKLRRLAAATLALGALGVATPAAMAQQAASTPDWEPPAEVKPSPKAKGAAGKAHAGKTAAGKTTAGAPGGLNAPMRKIDRSDIDMSGVGRDVRNFGSGVRPMMTGGGMGVGGGF